MKQSKSGQEIKEEYASLLVKSKIVSIVFALLILPRIILGFTSQEIFLGLNQTTAIIPMVIGIIAAGSFYYLYWRCPACKELPGDSWSQTTCNKCNVSLK